MAFFTEFYLTTVWNFKPNVVRRVIDDFAGMGLAQAEFTYDSEYGWFKVTCLEEHASEIPTVDHEWFTQLSDTATTRGIDEPSASSCLSQPLTESSRTALWDDLDKNNEPYTVHQIMTVSERDQIQEDLRVELSSRLAGKLVYITGQSEEFIRKARDRLRVMLAIEKLRPSCLLAEHLVYAENYLYPVQPDLNKTPEITADMRYLANIDPKLASSTLLD